MDANASNQEIRCVVLKKPHITKEYSLSNKGLMWFCRGQGRMAMEYLPFLAYTSWLEQLKNKGALK